MNNEQTCNPCAQWKPEKQQPQPSEMSIRPAPVTCCPDMKKEIVCKGCGHNYGEYRQPSEVEQDWEKAVKDIISDYRSNSMVDENGDGLGLYDLVGGARDYKILEDEFLYCAQSLLDNQRKELEQKHQEELGE